MSHAESARTERSDLIPRGGALPERTWRKRHRAIVAIAWTQVPLLLVVGWATGTPWTHLLLEVSLVALAAGVASYSPTRVIGSVTATFALVTTSALLVHFSHGLIEMHFHFFVVVAIVTLYQDWRPFLVGLAYVVVHHALFGTLHPSDVYNHPAALANPRLWALIHGLFILGASAAGIVNWRFNESMTGRLEESLRNLKDSEARFRSLIQNSFDVVAVVDEDLRFNYASAAATAATGHDPRDLIGRKLTDLVHPADLDRARSALGDIAHAEGGTSASLEVRVARPDGSWTWIELRASNRLADEEIEGLVLNYHNVSARRAVQEENDKLAALVAASPDAILRLSPEGEIVGWNKGAEAVYGYDAEEVLGKHIDIIVPGDEHDELHDALSRVAEGANVPAFDAVRLHRNGQPVHVSVTMFPFRDSDGNVAGIASIARDIGDQVAAEKTQEALETQLRHAQRMQSIGQLAGGVAHDFNNILAIIMNSASFLLEEVQDGQAKEDVDEILKASRRGAALVRQLLLFSRKEVAQLENLDANAVIKDGEKLIRRSVGEDIEVELDLAGSLPPVYMDKSQIDQIIINLAVNARDAMPHGGRFTIRTNLQELEDEVIQVHPEMAQGVYVCIAFSDTGHGMTREVQQRIFDPFFTTKERGEGTGLGLATVYGIVKQAGGYIYVYSERGSGTTFRIYLPPSESPSQEHAVAKVAGPQVGGAERILVVEDDEALRRMSARILKGAGYDVITAGTPSDALAIARTTDDIDLLLSDVVMPVMTGRALAEAIWNERGPLRVVFMSGYTSDVITRRGELKEGITLLQKPFSSRELLEAVRDALDTEPVAPPPSPSDLSILVVDDEPVFRDFLRAVIDDIGHVGQVLVASDGREALELHQKHGARIAFVDSLNAPMGGGQLAERLRESESPPAIVAVTASTDLDKPWADAIIRKGARLVDEISRVIEKYR